MNHLTDTNALLWHFTNKKSLLILRPPSFDAPIGNLAGRGFQKDLAKLPRFQR